MNIAENLKKVKATIPENVELIAVSKTKPDEDILAAFEAGQHAFGENKVQDLAAKAERLPKEIQWHMIGHVQTNKIKYFAPFVHLVHGVDREKVLKILNKEAAKCNRTIDCLLQVHIAEEDTKFGFDAAELKALLASDVAEKYPSVRIRGLMGMATFTEDKTQVEREFKSLKKIFDDIQNNLQSSALYIEPSTFNILSMGMSGDYEIAMECGSNMVRIGTAIFGARNY